MAANPLARAMDEAAALFAAGRLEDAKERCDAILRADPRHFYALHLASVIAARQRAWEDCVRHASAALEVRPGHPEVLSNRGAALRMLQRFEEALADQDRALAAAPASPDAHNNRGVALASLERHEEALHHYGRALAAAPGNPDAHNNRGLSLVALNRHAEAIESYTRAIALDPGHHRARWNRAMASLALGDFEHGLADYESRWRGADVAIAERPFAAPRWDGRVPLAGKTIFVHAEQGLGDAIQFVRFARELHTRGARVVLEAPAPLVDLFAPLPWIAQVMSTGTTPPAHDFQAPLMSLPFLLGTRLATIPPQEPALAAPPAHVAQWRARLASIPGPRVGLAWSGNATFRKDALRAIPLAAFEGLRGLPASCIALQKEIREVDLPALGGARPVHAFADDIEDFRDTASMIELVDIVISNDTSVAHLAGAMGKPVWIVLPFSADWRWFLARDDSPWYPSARLFRQDTPGRWDATLARVTAALRAALASGPFARTR